MRISQLYNKLFKLVITFAFIGLFAGCGESSVYIESPDDGLDLVGANMMDDVTFRGTGWNEDGKSEITGEQLRWYLKRQNTTQRHLIGTGNEFTTNFTPTECGYNPLVVFFRGGS